MKEMTTQTAPTNIANQIEASTGHDLRLDTYAKTVLADVQVLAYLLKYSVKEFSDQSMDEIRACIEPDIRIGEVRVEPGLTNAQRIEGCATEDNVPNEGKIFFDIVFRVRTAADRYEIIVNVEAQRSSDPTHLKYHLENRMSFYLARLISSQKQIHFTKSNYDDIKKVKSIWICMDSQEDSILRYNFTPEMVFGSIDPLPQTNLMEGIIIRIRTSVSRNLTESKNHLIAMLEHLFSSDSLTIKKQKLEHDGLKMTETFERSVDDMCNYSVLVKQEGRNEGRQEGLLQGRQQGLSEGRQEGLLQGTLNTLVQLVCKGLLTYEQAVEQAKENDLSVELLEQMLKEQM